MTYKDIEEARTKAREYYRKNRSVILEKSKVRRDSNKEQIKESNREWYIKHKEEYLAKKNCKVECECGKTISRNNRHEHYRSKYHQSRVNSQGNI